MDLFNDSEAFDVFEGEASPANGGKRKSAFGENDEAKSDNKTDGPTKRARLSRFDVSSSSSNNRDDQTTKFTPTSILSATVKEDDKSVDPSQQPPPLPPPQTEQKKKKRGGGGGKMVAEPDEGEVTPENVTKLSTPTSKECKHEIAIPKGYEIVSEEELFNPPFPANPARKYKFVLDPFQRTAVSCLERGDSVLVSAHTSAGKTVVAEYAIAMSLRDKQRVIYTSPIKALSNQKYRELYEEFQDVGLMTGDVTINPTASCLVMTTEILRSMLYRGSEIMREVAWVIFDEIHYMRDKERGVVWEETIILLPDKVRYVFLSATIPNAIEFADWIASLHQQPCHVVYTEYRPTPLQHYIFPAGGDGLHLVVDEQGRFREDNFQKALAQLASTESGPSNKPGGGGRGGRRNRNAKGGAADCYKIVKMIMERNYEPVIIFSFSKRECESMALQMSKLDFNNDDEKKLVESVFMNAIDSLSDDDKRLPQVEHILPLLKRGIGIHHGGLLPILKEVIEILFQEGLLKALFATETFSMGLNMPAKTVVFTNVRKFDGQDFRTVSPGEYIQMSGRAGRRGLDDRGIIILMVDEKMEPHVAKNMLRGTADPLNSTFHLGYNMLLNLLRVEGVDPEYLIKRSFHQFQNDRSLPQRQERLQELEEKKKQITIPNEEVVAEYFYIREQLRKLKRLFVDTVNQPVHVLPFLQPGRLVHVVDKDEDWGWGVVVNFQKKNSPATKQTQAMGSGGNYIVDVLLKCAPSQNKGERPRPYKPTQQGSSSSNEGQVEVVPVMLPLLEAISAVRVYVPKDLRSAENRQSVGRTINEVLKRYGADGPTLLDPIEDMNITDEGFRKVVRKIETLENRLQANAAFKSPEMSERYTLYTQKIELEAEIRSLRKFIQQSQDVVLKDKLVQMKRVLRRLGLTNKENIIELKGRVACEINAADELVLTELIFTGVLNELTVEQIVAIVSCFVFEEKSDSNQKLQDELVGPLKQLQDAARKVAKVMAECKITIDVEEYVEKFKPHMMDVVFSWCKGAKFADICKMTNVFEGSIIRCMRRLEELLRQLCAAAKAIGNTELEAKFAEGITKIKRDIVFAVSLYL